MANVGDCTTPRRCGDAAGPGAALQDSLLKTHETEARVVVIDAHGFQDGTIGRTLKPTVRHSPLDLIALAGGNPFLLCKLLIIGACKQSSNAQDWALMAPNAVVVTASHETTDRHDWPAIALMIRAGLTDRQHLRTVLRTVAQESGRTGSRIG